MWATSQMGLGGGRVYGALYRGGRAAPLGPLGVAVIVLAIDPGYEQSAWLVLDGERVLRFGTDPNTEVLEQLRGGFGRGVDALVIEGIESMGMAVGKEVFETVFWTGRFVQRVIDTYIQSGEGTGGWSRIYRRAVKIHLCGSVRAQDSNIRQALLDRFGGSLKAIGHRRQPGPLHGLKKHEWSALALAVTWMDLQDPKAADARIHAAMVGF